MGIAQDITERRAAEAALQESQMFIQRIAEAIPDMLFVFDLKLKRIIYTNRQVQATLGYTPSEIMVLGAASYNEFLPPEVFTLLPALVNDLLEVKDGEIV